MPAQKNIIQFSVPQDILDRLELQVSDEEKSASLVAKRIFLEAIGENSTCSSSNIDKILEDLSDRIDKLENRTESDLPLDIEATLKELGERLATLETNFKNFLDLNSQIEREEKSPPDDSPVRSPSTPPPPKRSSRRKN